MTLLQILYLNIEIRPAYLKKFFLYHKSKERPMVGPDCCWGYMLLTCSQNANLYPLYLFPSPSWLISRLLTASCWKVAKRGITKSLKKWLANYLPVCIPIKGLIEFLNKLSSSFNWSVGAYL